MGTLNRAIGRMRLLGAALAMMFGSGFTSEQRTMGAQLRYSLENHYRSIRMSKGSNAATHKRAARKRRNIAKRRACR